MFENPWVVVLLTVAVLIVLRLLLLLVLSGGSMERIKLAIRSSFRTLRDPTFAAKTKALLEPPPPPPPPKPSGAPLRLLALLQREGRLIDFLLEDLTKLIRSPAIAVERKGLRTREKVVPGPDRAPSPRREVVPLRVMSAFE